MNEVTTLRTPDSSAIEKLLAPLRTQAEGLEVVNAASHEMAQQLLTHYKKCDQEIHALYDDDCDLAHKLHKSLTTKRSALLAVTDFARKLIGRKMDAYEAAERRRVEAETRRQTEEAAARERERLEFEAAAAEEAGDTQAAAEIMAEPVVPAPVVVAPAIARVEGVSTATRYRAEVEDLAALVRHVAAHPEHINLVMANGPALNKLAVALRDAMQIPGVRVVKETDRRVRG